MGEDSQTRKNCLQWGLRVISTKDYIALIKKYAIYFYPNACDQIKKAHIKAQKDEWWWWGWLSCEIRQEGIWINIGMGRRFSEWASPKISKFPSWSAYVGLREELRIKVAKHFRDNPMSYETLD